MMDIKDIIKWFIPCFHILLIKMKKLNWKLTVVCLFLFFNSCAALASVNSVLSENVTDDTKNLVNRSYEANSSINESELVDEFDGNESRSLVDASVGRTFGPRFKKIIAGLLPVIFQVGAASTWAVVAALVGFKTLLVALAILKLLLLAGAAKVGALFASKGHAPQQPAWQPPHQKEIHLHIYNGHGHEHEEHVPISSWSRDGSFKSSQDPYRAGPQTISTPFGNYIKIEPGPAL